MLILRLLSAPLCIVVFAAALSSAGWAKDTGLVFVSNEKTNNLIVLDPKTNKVVKDLRTSRRPRDMHFNADHTKLYVACGDDDVIDIIDVAKLEVVGKLSTGSSCAARVAGIVPNTIPTKDETTMAMMAERPEMGMRNSVKNRTENGMANPTTIPITPPISEIKIASDRNW